MVMHGERGRIRFIRGSVRYKDKLTLHRTGYGPGHDPYAITVSPGDKVIWDNQDTVVHTATVRPDGKFDTS